MTLLCTTAAHFQSGVLADLDIPRIEPSTPFQTRQRKWAPQSKSASGFGPPFADYTPPPQKTYAIKLVNSKENLAIFILTKELIFSFSVLLTEHFFWL